MENREALLNAGFEPQGEFESMPNGLRITSSHFVIYVNYMTLEYAIHTVEGNEMNIVAHLKNMATDLEDFKATCYGYIGYYLDFTAKPKYDWETVKAKLSPTDLQLFTDASNGLYRLQAHLVIDNLEIQSMIAKLKLNIIIQQIDKDYPPVPTETVIGGIRYQDGELQVHYFQDGYSLKNSKIITATTEGAQILLDQNTQLLKNLFKIETDA